MFYFISLLFVGDRLIKYLYFASSESNLCNEGIAFGISVPMWFILLGTVFFFMLFLQLFCKERYNLLSTVSGFGLAAIFLGAISNFFDRVMYACVIDYIKMPFINLHFNIADMFIVFGALLYLSDYLNNSSYDN